MYDYGLSVLEQYGLTASFSGRVRGALLCRTEKGPVILREFHGSEKKLSMQQLLEKMKEQNCLVDAYLRNREGVLVSRDKDSVPYTAQIWFEGRECDTRSENDIFKKYPDSGTDPTRSCSFLWKWIMREEICRKNISGIIRK